MKALNKDQTLPAKVVKGEACRFCERAFVTHLGQPIKGSGHLTVCGDCWDIMTDHFKYQRSRCKTKETEGVWSLRKSEILREIQSETEDDPAAFDLERKIVREAKKENFEDLWLPKFKRWLNEKITWDLKRCCYTLHLSRDTEKVVMDYYPKGDKLLIRNENRWYHGGLNFLIKDVLPEEYRFNE